MWYIPKQQTLSAYFIKYIFYYTQFEMSSCVHGYHIFIGRFGIGEMMSVLS